LGLTAQNELSLRDAGLITFFDSNRAGFKAVAQRSYTFAKSYVDETDLPLRLDDVATALVAALVTNESLRDFLAAQKLRQQFWYARFADLILDRLWEELSNEPDAGA
jgi:hypothetical protein